MKHILLAAAILLVPGTNCAQTTFATITGLITDPNGAVIPGATVVVTNADTNDRYSARSNDTGYYSIGQLVEGVYDLSAESPGFARFEQRGIRVTNQEFRRIDIQFELASVRTAVEVNGGASLIETEKARISDTKGADVIKSLPLNQRSLWDFVGQNPSVIQVANGSAFTNAVMSVNGPDGRPSGGAWPDPHARARPPLPEGARLRHQ